MQFDDLEVFKLARKWIEKPFKEVLWGLRVKLKYFSEAPNK